MINTRDFEIHLETFLDSLGEIGSAQREAIQTAFIACHDVAQCIDATGGLADDRAGVAPAVDLEWTDMGLASVVCEDAMRMIGTPNFRINREQEL